MADSRRWDVIRSRAEPFFRRSEEPALSEVEGISRADATLSISARDPSKMRRKNIFCITALAYRLRRPRPFPQQSEINNQQFLSRPGLSANLSQNLRRYFLQRHAELKHRRLRPPPPARHFPMRAHKFHVGMCRHIEQQRPLSAIKLLAKRGQCLRAPRHTLRRPVDGDCEPFLLDGLSDGKRYQKHAIGRATHVYAGTITLNACHRFRRNQNRVQSRHGEKIVANHVRRRPSVKCWFREGAA